MKAHELAPWAEEAQRLRTAPVAVLVARYEELFAERPRTRHRVFLWRRICWRLQAHLQGGLSERAHARALEIADDRAEDFGARGAALFFALDGLLEFAAEGVQRWVGIAPGVIERTRIEQAHQLANLD